LQLGTGATAGDFRVDTNALNAIIEKKVETGATLTMEYNIEKAFLDPPPFAIFNPSAEAYIEAKVTQPLLKSAGIFYNRSDIYIARNDKKRSVLELKETAIEVTNSTQTAYWELVKAIEELRVRRKSLERAEDLLKKNKIQVDVGTMAPIELLVAEEGVASQLEGVVVAENDIKDREDELMQVMNLSNNPILSDVSIVPLDYSIFSG
jgi:outer membrane protein TolC